MTTLILIPGLAGNGAMWRALVPALGRFHPAVTDVNAREESIPAMARALLADHAGPLVLCGAMEQPEVVNATLIEWLASLDRWGA